VRLRPPEPLDAAHLREDFDSGVASLDEWLRRRALANQASGASRVYVTVDEARRVAGYYAISAASIAMMAATARLKRNMPDPIPMALIGRLAVDRRWRGQGVGAGLLQDALGRIAAAAQVLGVRGVFVHALSDEAAAFYRRYGFEPAPGEPHLLALPLPR
jgi:GNAT superfamily N-acetyltransferase